MSLRRRILTSRRASRRFALALILVCAVPLRPDVLILKDGSRVSGHLTFCDEETCSLGKKVIALDKIAQIGLGAGPKVPTARRGGNVFLADGTLRPGRFTGLNLAYVYVDDEEVERDLVAVIVPGAARNPPKDLLVVADGSSRSGTLDRCNGATCTFDGAVVRLDQIAWIGLGQEGQDPPSATSDAIYLLERDPVAARLTGADADSIATTGGTFPRADVIWIHVAPPQQPAPQGSGGVPIHHDTPSQQPPSGQSPAPASGQPPPAQPPAPGAPSGGTPSRPAPPSSMRRGPLWTGTIDSRLWGTYEGVFSTIEAHVDVKLREYIGPMLLPGTLKSMGTISGFNPEGTVLRNSITCSGPGISCSGQGTTTITANPGSFGTAAAIYRKTTADSMAAYGFEVPQGKALYWVGVGLSDNPSFDVTWRTDVTSVSPSGFMSPVAGRSELEASGMAPEFMDPQYRYLEGGAMRGSFSKTLSDGKQYAVSWSVCPERMACAPAPPLPGAGGSSGSEDDPCARSGQQSALSDTCRSQLDNMLDSLGPALARYNELMASAEANRGAFRDAQNYCALYDKAKEVLEAILSGGAGPAAEAARALLYLRDVIEKVQDGDLASMLYPDEAKKFLGYYKKAKDAWFELTADEVSKMSRDLRGCSGKMPADTYLGAQKFVADLAAAKEVWNSKVAPGMNDLRSKGLECAGLAHAAWQACIDDAKCRGVPPACGPEPTLEGSYDN